MILNNGYTVHPSANFKRELGEIIYYIKYKLKESSLADKFYKKVLREIASLKFMPDRFPIAYQLDGYYYRKLLIGKYIVLYEVHKETGQVFISHIFHSKQNYLNLL